MKLPSSGAIALAHGAIESGVKYVSSYPGSPATGVVNAILELTAPDSVQVEWTSNEKVAIETAFGASLGGQRTLLCVKGVGLNIALDPLMTINLSGCNAGFVILVGDDPGGWGSQNEQDSRGLAQLTEIPWLEPTSVSDAYRAMRQAFDLSEEFDLPVAVRITRALALAEEDFELLGASADSISARSSFQRESMRWVVLPINVVAYHDRLVQRLDNVRAKFEESILNGETGGGKQGIVAAGFVYQKLVDALDGHLPARLQLFRLGTFHPLPIRRVSAFMKRVESILVLEESAPLVERGIRALAQSAGLTLPVFGRDTGHVPRTGELFAPNIVRALNRVLPDVALSTDRVQGRSRPSREPLCDGCPYTATFNALFEVVSQKGGRDAFIVVGDPGCMVRAQMPPFELMDVKHGLGSAIGLAAGIAIAQRKTGRHIVALCGDSGFLHSGFNGLVDAARLEARMLVLILDNGTTALSGRQPHPGSEVDARGRPRRPVDLASMAWAAGANTVQTVDIDGGEDIFAAIAQGIESDGLAVVIGHGQCVLSR